MTASLNIQSVLTFIEFISKFIYLVDIFKITIPNIQLYNYITILFLKLQFQIYNYITI